MAADESIALIEELYYTMYDTLYAYALLHASDLAPPEELIQETFQIACTKSSELLCSKNRQGWIMLTMKNVIRSARSKQQSRHNTLTLMTESDYTNYIATEDPIDLRILYGNLAETEDFKLIMEQVNGYSIQELAQKRGISEDACKKRLVRAKKALRKKIEQF